MVGKKAVTPYWGSSAATCQMVLRIMGEIEAKAAVAL